VEGCNEHAEALDWLVRRVSTPFFITLDSDVEFLRRGWLTDILSFMEREDLAAVGEFEPEVLSSRPRLAPYLLGLRTASFLAWKSSFRGSVRFARHDELVRWRNRNRMVCVDVQELAAFPTATLYPVGAILFESMQEHNAKWAETPKHLRSKYRHLGHMSWANDENEVRGTTRMISHHKEMKRYVTRRLADLAADSPATVMLSEKYCAKSSS
jgi:hypothetical protein